MVQSFFSDQYNNLFKTAVALSAQTTIVVIVELNMKKLTNCSDILSS